MAKERLKIAVDCDDVLVAPARSIANDYHQRYGVQVQMENFYSRDPAHWGVSDIKIAERRVNDYLVSEEFTRLEPFTDAVAAINGLSSRHTLYMVTARSDDLISVTESMAQKFFPGCFAGLEFTNHFGESHKRRSKGEVCRELGGDVLVDDNPYHINSALTEAALTGG